MSFGGSGGIGGDYLALVHSKGNFEEYAVLILAYLNAEREADAALKSWATTEAGCSSE